MRVAFVGKGGSGKTTISSLFALYAASTGKRVLALDADINQHLASAMGIEGTLRSMGEDFTAIKEHLRGDNRLFEVSRMHKTTPPGTGSHFVRLEPNDWFIKNFCKKSEGVFVAGAGDIPEGNVGVKCYHGLNGAIELVLGHILDDKDDVVVVDMTAGADAFSSSMFAKVDALVLVVEATLKSASVYTQFMPNVKKYNIPLIVVGNKIQDESDAAFLAEKIQSPIATTFGISRFIKMRERGENVSVDDMDESLKHGLSQLYNKLAAIERDWDALEKRSHELHKKNALSWMGHETLSQIDSSFSLKEFAESKLGQ
jgi:CO dehydrogenase maturation factor